MRPVAALCIASWLVWSSSSLLAAPTAEQQAKATAADEALKAAGKLLIAKKYEDALPLVVEAQKAIAELLAGNEDAKKLAAPLERRLESTRRLLEKHVTLPPFEKPGAKPAGGTPAADGISFTKQVAPIFVARCNNCHVQGMRGNLSLATYNNVMKGNNDGKVVQPGKADGSRLIEVLASGDMPRGGGRLTNEQIETIAKWIDQGAKFDGTDANAAISASVPAAPQRPALQVVQASGNETIRFSRDIAPVLASQCIDCHDNDRPEARLGLDTFARLLAGSENGPILTPGKPAESELIRRLKGDGRERMPRRRPALPPETIAKFEKWIAEGAKFDWSNANENTDMVARIYKASVMSHDELAAERSGIAAKNWTLANPDDKPDRHETQNFILLGNVGEDYLAEIGKLAEAQQGKVARILRAPSTGPLVKGRVTLFVFKKRYDYSEFGKMVEKRDLPPNWHGHWKYTIVDAYAAMAAPTSDESSMAGIVAEQLAGVYLESLGKMPHWFAQGSAWAVGAAAEPKDPRGRQWDDSVPRILAQCSKPDDFLNNALPPADTAVLNYSFCKFLMSNAKSYTALLNELKSKKDFDQALATAYRADARQLAAAWASKAALAQRGK
jgi:mono/diheme cytochrome c family protein